MRLVQGMYVNGQSDVCVGEGYSEEFEVKASIHQGSVLFIIVLEVLSTLGSLRTTSMLMTFLSSLNHSRNVSEGS